MKKTFIDRKQRGQHTPNARPHLIVGFGSAKVYVFVSFTGQESCAVSHNDSLSTSELSFSGIVLQERYQTGVTVLGVFDLSSTRSPESSTCSLSRFSVSHTFNRRAAGVYVTPGRSTIPWELS